MNQDENKNFDFEEYRGKVVGEKRANNQLKRQNARIKAHMAAVLGSAVVALAACTYVETVENADSEVVVTETGGVPFSEEKIAELQGNVVILDSDALKDVYKNMDSKEKKASDLEKNVEDLNQKDTQSKSINQELSTEQKEIIGKVLEDEVRNAPKNLSYIADGNQKNQETKDLTQTQILVREAIDTALRTNALIGKDVLSKSELDQVIKNSEVEHKKAKERRQNRQESPIPVPKREDVSPSLVGPDPEYWKVEDTTYVGINPPLDTGTSVWVPVEEDGSFKELEDGVYKVDPTWRQVSLEFDKIMHHMSYGDACSINEEQDSINFIPVYVTVDSAIKQTNPLQEKKNYQEFLDAKIGGANALIAGIYVPIEKVDDVSSFDDISFSLEKPNQDGKMIPIGYINGNDLVNSLSRNMIDMVQEENSSLQR